ncbi:hypothetical protein SLE2022_364260 [Rubroshorea leprosula]
MESSKCVSFILFLLLLLPPSSNSISFQIPNFTPSPNYILYKGDAVSSLGIVELTNNVESFSVGWVTYANEVLMWDSKSRKLSDFIRHFSFSIDAPSPNITNDGIEFFIAPVGFQIPPNFGSGYLGLFNITTRYSSLNRIILVDLTLTRTLNGILWMFKLMWVATSILYTLSFTLLGMQVSTLKILLMS